MKEGDESLSRPPDTRPATIYHAVGSKIAKLSISLRQASIMGSVPFARKSWNYALIYRHDCVSFEYRDSRNAS